MTAPRGARRHIDTRTALDYLEGRLSAARRAAMEQHLGSPCPDCRARLRAIAELAERMRADRAPEVSPALRGRALEVFRPRRIPAPSTRLITRIARLLFDSAAAPMTAAVRRSVGEARRLRFELGDDTLELECEHEGGGMVTLRGRLDASEPALFRVEIAAGTERFAATPDARGAFLITGVPEGRVRVAISGPATRFRVAAFAL